MTLTPEQAVNALSQRGDIIAKELGVEEGPGWRDNTGTAHLIIRGALQSLGRMKDGQHSIDEAGIAIGTVGFAGKSPDGFLLNDVPQVAEIAKKILTTEMAGGSLGDAISADDLTVLKSNLASFRNDILGASLQEDADPSLKAFAGALDIVNDYYQKLDFGFAVQPAPSAVDPALRKDI